MKTVNIALAVLALLATGAALVRWQSLARLRAESAVASATNDAAMAGVPMSASADPTEIAALRERTKDLPRLRNEISQLRAATNEIVALQKENARLAEAKQTGATIPTPVPPGFVTKDQLTDAGLAMPDAAVQTFFWAMLQTNFPRVVDTWSAGMKQKEGVDDEGKRAQLERDFAKGTVEMMRRFNNFGIVEREQVSPTVQVLHISSSFGKRAMKVRLVLEDAEWKIDKFE